MLYDVFLPLPESRTPFKLRLLARDQIQINGGVAIGQLDDSTLPTLVVISRLQSTNTILPHSKTKELTSQAAA